jgi:cyclopropane-fatty-acyl-phospholipid synthase
MNTLMTKRADTVYSGARAGRRSSVLDRWAAAGVQRTIERVGVRVELWDGWFAYHGPRAPVGSIVVLDRRTLYGLLINPDLYFGEAYSEGRLEVRGPLEPVLEAISRSNSPEPSALDHLRAVLALPNTLSRSRDNVHHHYDLGNDFYRLWLDEELVYTCAYFADPAISLEGAQRAKHDLVCRKLRLRAGESVIEAGRGWGALALHMARHYGVRVRAFNVSREQLAYARERAAREGLEDRVEFVDDDYRNVTGTCDAFVSVGMLEHVGLAEFETFSQVVRRVVPRSGGRGLLHFIGRDAPHPLNAWIRRRIFPGAYPPTLAQVTGQVLAPAGMSVLDIENLRLHYARTLEHWRERFSAHADEVAAKYGEPFRRAWDLYLAGSQAAFTTGWLQLFQVVFSPWESPPHYWSR